MRRVHGLKQQGVRPPQQRDGSADEQPYHEQVRVSVAPHAELVHMPKPF